MISCIMPTLHLQHLFFHRLTITPVTALRPVTKTEEPIDSAPYYKEGCHQYERFLSYHKAVHTSSGFSGKSALQSPLQALA